MRLSVIASLADTAENASTLDVGSVLQTIGSVLGLPAIILAVIVWALNRKGANKKLSLEERAVGVTEFEALVPVYKDIIERQNESIKALLAELPGLKDRIADLESADAAKSEELDSANLKLEIIRRLIQSYIDRTGVPMTAEEQAVFDQTIPSPRLRRTD